MNCSMGGGLCQKTNDYYKGGIKENNKEDKKKF